ncbi:hypothetical protein EDD15DRAFT_2302615 [Pisolithus albus]|nr:hypothetical protein EDD15DRAFT_2302615 [Pisolithus albus]
MCESRHQQLRLNLFAEANPKYDEVEVSKWQAAEVTTLTVDNFIGRLLFGEGLLYISSVSIYVLRS